MKAIVRAFGVARANLFEQRSKRQKASAGAAEPEAADGAGTQETAENGLLSRIRELVGERPGYGYRRVTALLNRERTERVNPKRIYRIMRRTSCSSSAAQVTAEAGSTTASSSDSSQPCAGAQCFEIRC